ncbi:RNA-guided endonuclease InsQ/TnpB family protein [Azospirillum aestuarii]|uniref:RNA-guided endonuclease InsQ/TnpB family protein n=1 Tax=Azospirillum aestuarii TaxID=2802052 RepID=UPI004054F154
MLNVTRIRLYPTSAQQQGLAVQFGCARWAWNNALNEMRVLYRETGKGLSYAGMTLRLPKLKQEFPWLEDADSQVLQQALRNLAASFQGFFERRLKYPRFKTKHGRQSIQYPQRVKIDGSRIYLPKVGWVTCVVHREIIGKIKTVTVSKNACGQYHAAVLTDNETPMLSVSVEGKAIGVDVGLLDLAVTSDGSKFANPKHLRKAERNLKRKQRKLSRKVKGSNSRANARRLVARAHQRIADARRDHLHKLSRRIVNENQVIVVEDLHVKGMMKNHSLARAIGDAGWGMFTRFLAYKAERDGKAFVKTNRFYPSSKACSECGVINDRLSLDVRHWTCPHCGARHDRDINAAKNIRDEGLRALAAGTVAAAGGGNVSHGRGRKSSVHAVAKEARSLRQ